MPKSNEQVLTEQEVLLLITNQGGSVFTREDGRRMMTLPLDQFTTLAQGMASHAADSHRLLAAIVRQAGGLLEVDTQFVCDTEGGLRIEEVGEPAVTMLRIHGMAH